MVEWKVHPDSSIPLRRTLPRDLSKTAVKLLVGSDESEYDTVTFVNRSEGIVKTATEDLDLGDGRYEIQWKITYDDGTVEVLPTTPDRLKITS